MRVKSHVYVSAMSKLKNMLKHFFLEETDCRMEGNRCIHFTRTYQGAAKLTQKLKYMCEHIRFG